MLLNLYDLSVIRPINDERTDRQTGASAKLINCQQMSSCNAPGISSGTIP